MNKYFYASLFCSMGGAVILNAQSKDNKIQAPNIVMFLVDDMGWQDTSVPFWTQPTKYNKRYQTPNMERLASQGQMFTQAYACTVSSPSRCSLMSGMNAARHRVTSWTLEKNRSPEPMDTVLKSPDWNVNGICPVPGVERTAYVTSLAQLLKNNNYTTIMCGKAHFGSISTPAANPLNLGFDINIAGHAAGGPATYLSENKFGNTGGPNQSKFAIPGLDKYFGTHTFLTEALTLEALNALDTISRKKPFFLYMSHYAVHVPIEADKRFYQKYLDKGIDPREAAYASLVEGMDKSLGDIMNYLEKHNMDKNTIIIFMSDNGGLAAGAREEPLHTQNYPLRSGKGSAYEGGIREPMIVKWPGVVTPNTRNDQYLIIEDFFPTILEMADIKDYKTVQKVDGISFVPLLTGKGTMPKRDLYWHYPNKWGMYGPGIGTTSTIRSGDWKLIYYYKTRSYELYNIKDDIGEQNNLASKFPEKVKDLSKKLSDYLRSVDAQRPLVKATGKLAAWPDGTE